MTINKRLSTIIFLLVGTFMSVGVASGQDGDEHGPFKPCGDRHEGRPCASKKRSTALRFASDGQYVLVPNTERIDDIAHGLTLEAWVKSALDLPGGYRSIVSKRMNGTGYMLATNDFVHFKAEVAGRQATTASEPSREGWQHIAAVWDRRLKLYVNGQLDGVLPTSHPIPNSFELYIGSSPFGADTTWRGVIDEVRLWVVARTQEQIQSTMNHYLCGNELGLRAYWSFDEGQGSRLGDTLGHSDGVVVGPEWVEGVDLPRSDDCRHDSHR
jgi:hypothetical protein